MKELLTKQEAIRLYRIMWLWIADETLRRKKKVYKEDYFREMEISIENRPFNDCYCCEYSEQFSGDCSNCPLDWKSEIDDLMCVSKYKDGDFKGLFGKWFNETDYKKCAELARDIANLPEKIINNDKRKVLITNGMSNDQILIITDAPIERLKQWCKEYVESIQNGKNIYFDDLKKEYYVNVIFDSEEEDDDDVDIIGFDEVYDLYDYYSE